VDHLLQTYRLESSKEVVCKESMQSDGCAETDFHVDYSVLYFFCRGKIQTEPSEIFRTMVDQLLRQHPEIQKLQGIALQTQNEHADASTSQMAELLSQLINELKMT